MGLPSVGWLDGAQSTNASNCPQHLFVCSSDSPDVPISLPSSLPGGAHPSVSLAAGRPSKGVRCCAVLWRRPVVCGGCGQGGGRVSGAACLITPPPCAAACPCPPLWLCMWCLYVLCCAVAVVRCLNGAGAALPLRSLSACVGGDELCMHLLLCALCVPPIRVYLVVCGGGHVMRWCAGGAGLLSCCGQGRGARRGHNYSPVSVAL